MKATIREISRITGFSPATVSNALNKKKGVNSATSETIIQVAKELGYYEEATVKKIRFVMYKTNGLIIDDTPFFTMIMDGFQKECKRNGYEMVIYYLDRRDMDFEKQVKNLVEEDSSALVLVGAELLDQDFRFFESTECPLLIIDYWHNSMKYNGILINNEDAVAEAVSYLVSKGHKNIGYLKGSFRIKSFQARECGYLKGIEQSQLVYNPEYTVLLSTTMDGAYQDMKLYLKRNPKLPTAYFADNDMIALGAMKAMKEAGIKIPDEVSMVGFDDLPFSEISSPRLSSLRVPKQAMGEMAVHRVLEMMNSRQLVKTKILVCPEFIERDSVKEL
ncbi:LacI family DNA-binding transcriptional regulator [Velocimicrobium porci]|uniref:LacI family transcriptional regulator n=1 Tax=Velocimicrobium porci TaxID=2606634 RepID=A0A6L5XUM8_9FIRM|nr:LacI family DNA-binding transcriptional regulator [Velocimicrobium porci]MSS62314.1 LacI family transcriptional regulator [Velocimicrobium porci]